MDKLVCVGKNYLAHARELGDAVPEKPVLFLKPPSVLVSADGPRVRVPLYEKRGEVHHECEIVVRVSRDGMDWTPEEAATAFDAVTLGLDLTLREAQTRLKQNGHPWEAAKVFPASAIVGPWTTGDAMGELLAADFSLAINDETRQRGNAREMVFSVSQCLANASQHFPMRRGDLLFTGTPKGVGPLRAGDRCLLSWAARPLLEVQF